jgi:hypothetical protein
MKTRLIVAACLVAGMFLVYSASAVAQRGGTPGGGGRQGGAAAGGQRGTEPLGGVAALGQEVRRKPAPTGPVPHLPDATVDLSGLWVGGGVQVPTHAKTQYVYILHEGNIHSFRQVFMDGRKHPAELDPTWFGHSIGRYEGNTLVIDTVGFNDKSWFDNKGYPHTEQLHTIERWTRVDSGHMTNEVTIEDPGAYTKPFTVKFNARVTDPGDEIMEYICQENNQYGIAQGFQ